jgi:hypothetical protein
MEEGTAVNFFVYLFYYFGFDLHKRREVSAKVGGANSVSPLASGANGVYNRLQ